MSSPPDSPANRSASPGNDSEPTTPATYGPPSSEAFAWRDPATSSWRTFQASLLSDSETFSGTWPKRGTMRSGRCSELPMSVPLIGGIESGSSESWPTPTARQPTAWSPGEMVAADGGPVQVGRRAFDPVTGVHRTWGLAQAVEVRGSGPDGSSRTGGEPTLWPLPESDGSERFPTPTRSDAEKGYSSPPGAENQRGRETLSGAVQSRMWPTPCAADGSRGPDFARAGREDSGGDDLVTAVAREAGGPLNPVFVEWLMGVPMGWTEVE